MRIFHMFIITSLVFILTSCGYKEDPFLSNVVLEDKHVVFKKHNKKKVLELQESNSSCKK